MATGGNYYSDNTNDVTNLTDNAAASNTPNLNMLIIGIAVVTVIAVTVASTLLIKKRNK
jgi:hypothetical protein